MQSDFLSHNMQEYSPEITPKQTWMITIVLTIHIWGAQDVLGVQLGHCLKLKLHQHLEELSGLDMKYDNKDLVTGNNTLTVTLQVREVEFDFLQFCSSEACY